MLIATFISHNFAHLNRDFELWGVPVETWRKQHGERSATIVVGTERVLARGRWRSVEVLACPVTWRPHPEQIASSGRTYDDWWQALDWVRDGWSQAVCCVRLM